MTLETKCWQGDWKRILCTDWLGQLADRNRHPFDRRVLMINNVDNISRVIRHAESAVQDGRITSYIVVKEHAEKALDFFGLTAEEFGRGYVYSIAELVGLYLCQTDYLLHFAGDCMPQEHCEWLPQAMAAFEEDPRIMVANLSWDPMKYRYEHRAEAEAIFGRRGTFYLGQGFSDQCYFVRADDFRRRMYKETNPYSERYPDYGGELFEKRVDAWMRNHDMIRATFSLGIYDHLPKPQPFWSRLRNKVSSWRQGNTGFSKANISTSTS